jgi:tetratricopeptide (TPR) repeat protein
MIRVLLVVLLVGIRNPEPGIRAGASPTPAPALEGRGVRRLPPGKAGSGTPLPRIRDAGFGTLVPQESAQRLRAGQEKIKARDFDGAIPDFERCLQLQPEEYNARFGLGVCYWEKEDFRKARDHFSKVVEIVEKEQPGAPLPGVHQKLLGCAMLLEDFDAAVAEATRLIQFQPGAEYYYARALARQRKGDPKGAAEDCADALREDALLTKARTLRAYVILAGGDAEAGLAEYARAVQARASDPGGYLGRACAYYRLERWAEALQDLQSARKLNRGQHRNVEEQAYAAALASLAQLRSGRKSEAAEEARALRAVLKELQRDPAKNHLLGLPLYLAGELSEDELLRAAEAAPARKAQARCEVLFFIAERKLAGGDKAGARRAFKACVETGAQGNFEYDLAQIRLIVLGD